MTRSSETTFGSFTNRCTCSRHDNIPDHHKRISRSNTLQRRFKERATRLSTQIGQPVITTEGNEMQVPGLLIAMKALRHLTQPTYDPVHESVAALTASHVS